MLPLPFGLRRGRGAWGRGGGGVVRVHTCSASLSALTQSGERLTQNGNLLLSPGLSLSEVGGVGSGGEASMDTF